MTDDGLPQNIEKNIERSGQEISEAVARLVPGLQLNNADVIADSGRDAEQLIRQRLMDIKSGKMKLGDDGSVGALFILFKEKAGEYNALGVRFDQQGNKIDMVETKSGETPTKPMENAVRMFLLKAPEFTKIGDEGDRLIEFMPNAPGSKIR